jgi:hypothetical protein
MNNELANHLMEKAMPPLPQDAKDATKRFSAVQMQAFAFKAMEALLASLPSSPGALTITGAQLKNALTLAWPDGDADPDQAETVVTVCQRQAFVAVDEDGDNHDMPAGLYLTYDDYPEHGAFPLDEPEPATA